MITATKAPRSLHDGLTHLALNRNELVMSTQVCVVGTVATDPREIHTPSGVAFTTFRLASSERRFNRETNEWTDGETHWFTVNTFRSIATNAAQSFSKGERVIVSGKLRVKTWEKDGKQGTSVDIDADALGHDIRWGVSRFTKHNFSKEPEAAERLSGSRSE